MTIEKEVRILYEQSGAQALGQTLDEFDSSLGRLGTTGKQAFDEIGNSADDAAEHVEEMNEELDELRKNQALDKLRRSSDEYLRSAAKAEQETRRLERAVASLADPTEDFLDALQDIQKENALAKQLVGSEKYRKSLKETTRVQRKLELAALSPGARALAFVEGSDNVRGFIEVAVIAKDAIIALYEAIKAGAVISDLSNQIGELGTNVNALKEAAGGVITGAQAARVAVKGARLGSTAAEQQADLAIARAIASQQVLEDEGVDFREGLISAAAELQEAFAKGEIPENISLLDKQGTLQRSINRSLEEAARARGVTVDTLNAATRAEIIRNEALSAARAAPKLGNVEGVAGFEADVQGIFDSAKAGLNSGSDELGASASTTFDTLKADLELLIERRQEVSASIEVLDEGLRSQSAQILGVFRTNFEGTELLDEGAEGGVGLLVGQAKKILDARVNSQIELDAQILAAQTEFSKRAGAFRDTAQAELFRLIDTGDLATDKIGELADALKAGDVEALAQLIDRSKAEALLKITDSNELEAVATLAGSLEGIAAQISGDRLKVDLGPSTDDLARLKLSENLLNRGFTAQRQALEGQRARVDLDKSRVDLLSRQEKIDLARTESELAINEQIISQVTSLEEYNKKTEEGRVITLKQIAAQKAGLEALVEGNELLSAQDAELAGIKAQFSAVALQANNLGGSVKEINKQAAQGLLNKALEQGETDAILFTAALREADKVAGALGFSLLDSLGTGGVLDTITSAFFRKDKGGEEKKTGGGGGSTKVDLTAFKEGIERELTIGRLAVAKSGERLAEEVEASLPDIADKIRDVLGDNPIEGPITIDLEAATAFAGLQAKFEDQIRQAGDDSEALELVVTRFEQEFKRLSTELEGRLFATALEGAAAWGDGLIQGFSESADRVAARLAESRAEIAREAELALHLDDLRFDFVLSIGGTEDEFGARAFSDAEKEFLRASRDLEKRQAEELERFRDNKMAQLEIELFFNAEMLRLDRELKAAQAEDERAFFEQQASNFSQSRSDIESLMSEFETEGPVNAVGQAWLESANSILVGTEAMTAGVEAFIAGQAAATAAGKTAAQATAAGVGAQLGAIGQVTSGMIKDGRSRAAFLAAFEAAQSIASFASLNFLGGIQHAAAAVAFGAIAGSGAGRLKSSKKGGESKTTEKAANQRTSLTQTATSPFDRRFQGPSTINNFFSSALDNRPSGDIVAEALNASSTQNRNVTLASNLISTRQRIPGM